MIIARPEDVPQPPFWGARTLSTIGLSDVFAYLNDTRLFRVSWGARHRGKQWEQARPAFEERLTRMKGEALAQGWLTPKAVYGYFPVFSDGNALLVADPNDHACVLTRFSFPRQAGDQLLCLADYFLPVGSPKPDVLAIQVVTVGPGATERFHAMNGRDEYSEAFFSQGLAAQTTEAATELVCERIRQELGLPDERGLRFAWGFGALPNVKDHRKVFDLLPAEHDLGMSLTSAGQMIPEQSTATLIVHHAAARYFNT